MKTGQPKTPHQNQHTTNKLRIQGDNEIDSRNLEYDLHLGAKFDYFLHRTNLNVLASQVKLLQNQCELESTQMLTILIMASENTQLGGYVLTGNLSMSPGSNGSVAWLYRCPKVRSTLCVMEKCYVKNLCFMKIECILLIQELVRLSFLLMKLLVNMRLKICFTSIWTMLILGKI